MQVKMEVVITIEKQQPVGEMIKRFIKYRNKTIHEAADAMGITYNTFSYQLINDKLSVDTLFRLAVYLDIELNWMHMALGYFGPVNPLERENIPRMQRDFREEQRKVVLTRLESLIEENPSSTPDVRRALLGEFNMFFALDVLVPEEYDILMFFATPKCNKVQRKSVTPLRVYLVAESFISECSNLQLSLSKTMRWL